MQRFQYNYHYPRNYTEIAATIIDGNDNPSYGIVDFDPIYIGVAQDPQIEMIACDLIGNLPNPFTHSTTISFTIGSQAHVSIEIFNLKGQRIKTLSSTSLDKGTHSIAWNGNDDTDQEVPSGIYFYNLKVNNEVTNTGKCVLIR